MWRAETLERQHRLGVVADDVELVAPPRLGAGLGLARRRRAAALRPLHGVLRRLPVPRRRADRPGARLPRLDSASSTTRSSCCSPTTARRARAARPARSTTSARGTWPTGRSPRRSSASTRSAGPASTTTTRGAGPSPATPRSGAGSARCTRAACAIRSSCTGPAGIAARGEVRRQYVHAIDLLPTILDAAGVAAPRAIGGVDADADRGREHPLDVRLGRRRRGAHHAVLRDVRQPGDLPRRVEGGDLRVDARRRDRLGRRSRGSCTTSRSIRPSATTGPRPSPSGCSDGRAVVGRGRGAPGAAARLDAVLRGHRPRSRVAGPVALRLLARAPDRSTRPARSTCESRSHEVRVDVEIPTTPVERDRGRARVARARATAAGCSGWPSGRLHYAHNFVSMEESRVVADRPVDAGSPHARRALRARRRPRTAWRRGHAA